MRHVMPLWAVAVAACASHPITNTPDAPPPVEVTTFAAAPDHQLDLLIVVDDATGSDALQSLRAHIDALYGVLGTLDPPSYDLNLGVTTADLGTTGALSPDQPAPTAGGCSGLGDDGVLTSSPHVPGRFLHEVMLEDGTRQPDYTGSPLVAISELLTVGSAGCPFQQHARAITRALGNPQNAGFVRSTANLAIVMVADRDDCSARDPSLFDPASAALGPLTAYRCTSQGLACDQALDTAGAKTGCTAREDSTYIAAVAPVAQFLVDMKDDPRKLAVATITGPPSPVVVEQGGDGLALDHACDYHDLASQLQTAAPAVRDAALIAALPAGAATASATLCQPDLSPALVAAGHAIKRVLGDPCIDSTGLADDDFLTPGVQPYCGAVDIRDGDPTRPTVLPRCPTPGSDCFDIVADARVCPDSPDHLRAIVERVAPPPADAWTHVHCTPE